MRINIARDLFRWEWSRHRNCFFFSYFTLSRLLDYSVVRRLKMRKNSTAFPKCTTSLWSVPKSGWKFSGIDRDREILKSKVSCDFFPGLTVEEIWGNRVLCRRKSVASARRVEKGLDAEHAHSVKTRCMESLSVYNDPRYLIERRSGRNTVADFSLRDFSIFCDSGVLEATLRIPVIRLLVAMKTL